MQENQEVHVYKMFLSRIINYQHVVCFLLGNSPASEFYMLFWSQTFFPYKYPNIRNPSCSSYLPAYEDGTDGVFRNVGM